MFDNPQPKRRRGAPKGNLNAFKHGFYARQLQNFEISELQDMDPRSTEDEIGVMRIVIRRLMDLIQKSESPDQISCLTRTLTSATGSLGRLIHIYSVVSSGKSEADRLLLDVLTQLAQEWKLDSEDIPEEGEEEEEEENEQEDEEE